MIGMKPHPGLPFDEVGDARGRPQRRVVAEGLRSLTECQFDLVELGGAESGFATGASGLLQAVGPLRLPDGVPAPTGLGADTQASGDGGLAETTSEKFGRTEAALLELVKVALQSFEVSHTTFDTATPNSVHYIIQDSIKEENREALNDAFAPVQPDRMKSLLARGAAMALAIEKWTNKGLWVLCRSDQDYPQRLKQHLKRNAPPILYGAGERELLSKGGLAVVGSRNIDEDGEGFAREVGRCAAESGMQLVSGAARGVDETAMHGAFSAGGSVVGVMADSLLRAAVSGKYREGIRDGQLVLVSTFNPEAGFNVGNAMGRNKYIYALADYAVVVSADHGQGGTWAGAEEELKRESGKPVFVRISVGVPKGNRELIKLVWCH